MPSAPQAIMDINIWGPNSFGVVIGCIQIALRLYYGTKDKPGPPFLASSGVGGTGGTPPGPLDRGGAVGTDSMQELGLARGGDSNADVERMDSDRKALLASYSTTGAPVGGKSAAVNPQWSPLEAGVVAGKPALSAAW